MPNIFFLSHYLLKLSSFPHLSRHADIIPFNENVIDILID